MNIIRKKCMLITPCNVTFRLCNGRELKPNTKSVEFIWTKEILTALNSGIRVFEIGADGTQVQINKGNFDKINVNMNYSEEEAVEDKKEEVVVKEAPKTEEPVEEVKEEEPVEDPADSESPSEDEPEEEEAELTDTPQEDPEAKYYQDKSEDDCDEDKEDGEDDEYNVD